MVRVSMIFLSSFPQSLFLQSFRVTPRMFRVRKAFGCALTFKSRFDSIFWPVLVSSPADVSLTFSVSSFLSNSRFANVFFSCSCGLYIVVYVLKNEYSLPCVGRMKHQHICHGRWSWRGATLSPPPAQFQAKSKKLSNESSISELQDFKTFCGEHVA